MIVLSKNNFKFDVKNFFFVFACWIIAFIMLYLFRFYKVEITYLILREIEFNHYLPLISITLISLIFGIANGLFETIFNETIGKKLPFGLLILAKALHIIFWLNVAVISIITINTQLLGLENVYRRLAQFYLDGGVVFITIYVLFVSFLINLITQVSKHFGKGGLVKLLSGKYHRPKKEERIFMFLDMRSSTALAEKLGEMKYSLLLKEFFLDISIPIDKNHGNIFQYVGDEVVITWEVSDERSYLHAVNCFFDIKNKILKEKDKYINKFGLMPEFKAGVHSGVIVTTMVGFYKRDIVFHGDTINTTSRIQELCNDLNAELLISENLYNKLTLNSSFIFNELGEFFLKGKEIAIKLYSVEKKEHEKRIH